MTGSLILYAAMLILALAAVQDVVSFRISNLFPMLLIALFVAWAIMRGPDMSLLTNLGSFLFALAVGILLFARGWLGGGDGKLFAAAALWFGWPAIVPLLVAIAITGGVFAIILIVLRRALPASSPDRPRHEMLRVKGPIPYGVAIAIGAILCLQSPGPNPSSPSSSSPAAQPIPRFTGFH